MLNCLLEDFEKYFMLRGISVRAEKCATSVSSSPRFIEGMKTKNKTGAANVRQLGCTRPQAYSTGRVVF